MLVDYPPTDWEAIYSGRSEQNPYTLLPGIQIFKALHKQLKEEGYSFYILSNFKEKRFELLQKLYPEIFNLFDGIMLSEQCGYAKPDERIFQCLFNKYGVLPEEALFIDDGQDNVEQAQNLGMQAIWCDNFDKVKKESANHI